MTTAFEGKGTDICGTADEFCFFEQPWTGDGTVTVRVSQRRKLASVGQGRCDVPRVPDPRSKHVMAIVSPERGLAMQFRHATAGASVNAGTRSGAAPEWVRLVRSGHLHGLYVGGWDQLADAGTIGVPMNTALFVGLVVTSHDAAAASTGEFDNVSAALVRRNRILEDQWSHV